MKEHFRDIKHLTVGHEVANEISILNCGCMKLQITNMNSQLWYEVVFVRCDVLTGMKSHLSEYEAAVERYKNVEKSKV